MTIIKFPDSVGIRGNGGGSDLNRYDIGSSRKTGFSRDRSDHVEISPEAKMKFNEDNLIRLEKIKALKEAREYSKTLADVIRFKDADLRKIYRLNKITDANNKLSSEFYSDNEDTILRRLIEMFGV
ncbi:MAG: hypothetical protein FWG49_01565 [Leptospirales bacterium]|nr:hypothetical protein [Leptospirales bacterium]